MGGDGQRPPQAGDQSYSPSSDISHSGKRWRPHSPIGIRQPLKFPIALLSPVSIIACSDLVARRKALVRWGLSGMILLRVAHGDAECRPEAGEPACLARLRSPDPAPSRAGSRLPGLFQHRERHQG